MDIVILAGARTPLAKFGGSFKDISATDLAVFAAQETVRRSGLTPEQVDQIILGNVVQSSPDAIYLARHVGLKVGMNLATPALTVNRLCGSGLQAVIQAAEQILLGESQCVLAGGTENMSQIPYVMPQVRWGYRMGNTQTLDLLTAAMTDSFVNTSMGQSAENLSRRYHIDRHSQDEFAVLSHQRAAKARRSGRLAQEICPVTLPGKKAMTVEHDEHIREDANTAHMAKLSPAFDPQGTVTAGNASGINDGAATLLLTSADAAQQLGVTPMAKIRSWAYVGVEPAYMGIGPVPACQKALAKANLRLSDIDLCEINEAFAVQYLAVEKELGLNRDCTNINGGAIALGHPLGASGARVLITLLQELTLQNKRLGMASLCIGGGQGIAMIIENLRC